MSYRRAIRIIFLCSALSFGQASFTAGPAVVAQGGQFLVNFTISGAGDVEVAVLDASGKIVRHLAAGVLGGQYAPPPPLQAGLSQSLAWDGRNDAGGFPLSGDFKFRVRLNVAPVFDTAFDCHDIWPATWLFYPGGLDPQETYRPATDPFFNLLSYTGTPLYEQEHRLEVSASEHNDVLLVDGCASDQGLDPVSATVFFVNGTSGRVEKTINGSALNFGATSHYPGQGKAVYTWDGRYYLYRCAVNVYRFDLNGQPAPWPGTGSHIVENLPYNDIGSAGITPGPDGSVYVVHYPHVDTIMPQYVSKIVDGVVVSRGIVKVLGSLAGGVRVDREGNIYVGARVKPLADPWPDCLERDSLAGGLCESRSQLMWADEVYGSILKFGPSGGGIYADQAGGLEGGSGIYPNAACLPRIYDRCRDSNLVWMHEGLSHVLLHTTWRITKCWCNQTRFDIDDYGRIFYPNTFMNEFCGIDNSRNMLFRVKNRDVPQADIGVGHQVEVTDKALFVADFYNTQIVRFNWGSDREWTSSPFTAVEISRNSALPSLSFPNPYVPGAAIRFKGPGIVLSVYSMDGRQVRRVAGNSWDGKDNDGKAVPAGLYLFQLSAGRASVVSKAVLVK